MPLSDPQVRNLLEAVRETHDKELDCDGFLALMAELAEARAAGQPLPSALQLAEAHERLCPNCREECAALLEAISAAQ